jgi:dihydroxyacetone kinase-like protein
MSELTSDQMIKWLERFAALLAENKDHLTQLDSAIGDADHGANMDRGFKAVLGKKAEFQGKDIAEGNRRSPRTSSARFWKKA